MTRSCAERSDFLFGNALPSELELRPAARLRHSSCRRSSTSAELTRSVISCISRLAAHSTWRLLHAQTRTYLSSARSCGNSAHHANLVHKGWCVDNARCFVPTAYDHADEISSRDSDRTLGGDLACCALTDRVVHAVPREMVCSRSESRQPARGLRDSTHVAAEAVPYAPDRVRALDRHRYRFCAEVPIALVGR
jgi:hypothetical protein